MPRSAAERKIALAGDISAVSRAGELVPKRRSGNSMLADPGMLLAVYAARGVC